MQSGPASSKPASSSGVISRLDAVFVGRRQFLMPSGDPTGIFKNPLTAAAAVTDIGFVDDYQADKRFHGGPEKAIHQFAQASYGIMAERFPALVQDLVTGSMGENLSAPDMDEDSVFIGDIYRVGGTRLQVSQPRTPCWKINDRFGEPRLSRLVQERALSGWYYRVLANGAIQAGDEISLEQRLNEDASVRRFLRVTSQHRPALGDIEAILGWQGLAEAWRQRLAERLDWLRANT